ncbi:hypothetical protein WJX79_003443 [Trebouxia sp. C0005]
MPLPKSFDPELIAKAYPDALTVVRCGNKFGTFFGGHWAIWPTSSTDYFVSCACGCKDNMYTVYDFEDHGGRKASRKWRESIRVVNGSNMSLGQWIEDRCNAADAGLPEESSRVSVYWPADDEWYHGEVKDVDDCGRSHVKYDDGQVEILYFAVERYKLAEPIHSKDGTRTQHTLQSRDMKAGTVASYRQQTKIGQVPAAERTSVAKKRHRKSRDRGEDQHECQRQHSRKILTPIKAHRRSSKQDAAQAVIDQQGKHLADAQHTDALPQATQALPLSTQAQMHASGSAEPGTQLDSRLKKLPIHGPRLPDRTRPRNRSPKESASLNLQQKQDALEALIASVADGMTNARFLATIDRNQAEAACNISRYYQTVSKLVQRQPADQQGRDVLRVYFSGLFG